MIQFWDLASKVSLLSFLHSYLIDTHDAALRHAFRTTAALYDRVAFGATVAGRTIAISAIVGSYW